MAANDPRRDEMSTHEKLYHFVQENRVKIFTCFIAILVILAGLIIYVAVSDKLRDSALTKVEDFMRRYEEVKPYISELPIFDIEAFGGDNYVSPEQAKINVLLEDLAEFTRKTYGFPAARAYVIIAEINWQQKNWDDAIEAWVASAKAASKTYLAPISWFNAAAAAEEQDDIATALDYYGRALSYDDDFPMAARAQFAIGRLQELQGDNVAALEAYRLLLSKWPRDPMWADLAQSRSIVLSEY